MSCLIDYTSSESDYSRWFDLGRSGQPGAGRRRFKDFGITDPGFVD